MGLAHVCAEVVASMARKVVRCFEDNDIIHVNGKIDPEVDIDIINLELAFSDMFQVNNSYNATTLRQYSLYYCLHRRFY